MEFKINQKMKTTETDKWFSRYIRLRDADKNGCARCCTCGSYKPVKDMDCGHFIKRQHMATRFDEANCATQCKRCNGFEQGRDLDFASYISRHLGGAALVALSIKKFSTKKYTKFELDEITKYFKEKAIELSKEKGLKWW